MSAPPGGDRFPPDYFDPPIDRPESWPDDPDLRRAVDWLKTFMAEGEWEKRRLATATCFYDALEGRPETSDGRFFRSRDTFAWYLFQAEAYLDHFYNFDPTFGSRIIPLMIALGKNIVGLKAIPNVVSRVNRMVTNDQAQPNGVIFELLVAAAYLREGFEVSFLPEKKGQHKTHDMDVRRNGVEWAVECKRMEVGEYGNRERNRIRKLWGPLAEEIRAAGSHSIFAEVNFCVEISDVPYDYLRDHLINFANSGLAPYEWSDALASGQVRKLDLTPLKRQLVNDVVLSAGSQILTLLSGRYNKHSNYIYSLDASAWPRNPRYIEDCRQAILLHWRSTSDAAINAKARDITKRMSEANDQIPLGKPSIVHIGWEAVEGDDIEMARFEKIMASTEKFDPGSKALEYVYCHYLVPESPPFQDWVFEETVQHCPIRPTQPRPLNHAFLVPYGDERRSGTHWQ